MHDEFAVMDGETVLYQTAGFRKDLVTGACPLSEGKSLMICGQSRAELQQQLQEAEAAIAAKDAFLSSMSHDIRTPMNAIIGLTLLAKMHLDETERVSDALNKIETASSHLLSLINNVLDMSRINSGRMSITPEYFSLNDLIHDTLTMMRPQAAKKSQSLLLTTVGISEEILFGDILRLRQIFVNIISNAVKYTPDRGTIRVSFSEEPAEDRCVLIFRCEDNGIGMDEQFLQRIFEPFERVSTTTVSQIEGTGLGMSIVKKLTELMGGTIDISSQPGAGTTVIIRLPLPFRHETPDTDALRGKNLLILEADPDLREIYAQYLKEFGMDFILTSSVQETLDAMADADISRIAIDAVIIGNDCGRDDKLDFAAYLHKSAQSLPILLISEDNWEEIGYQAEHSGVAVFIPLPLFRRSLADGLQKALENSADPEHGPEYPDMSGKRILLVEDNMINQEIAKEILSFTGAEVDVAENGQEAVDAFRASCENAYSLILMDVQMPVMNGYQATTTIRAETRPDAQRVPIYAMTANTFAEDIAKATAAGMNGHIAKPIDVAALMQVLRDALG